MARIRGIVERRGSVRDDDFTYQPHEVRPLAFGHFSRLHDSLFTLFKDRIVDATDHTDHYPFPYSYLDYKGLRFHLLIGQGSATWVTKILES